MALINLMPNFVAMRTAHEREMGRGQLHQLSREPHHLDRARVNHLYRALDHHLIEPAASMPEG